MSVTTLEPAYPLGRDSRNRVARVPDGSRDEVTVSRGETVYRNDFSKKSRKPEGVWLDEEYCF